MYDILIIGGGPAGLTAATYARRAGKTVLVIEKTSFGGQITWSPRVENFPGFVSISGVELGDRFLEQAMEQGAEVELDTVCSVARKSGGFSVSTETGSVFEGKALIIATGARPRTLGLPGEDALTGNGVCYCAVCDGAFYKNRPVAVNGGGNSALQDAVLLSEKCSKVYVIHRRDSFRGEQKLVDVLKAKENVEFIMNASVTGLIGTEELKAVKVRQNDAERTIDVDGLFVAVGHVPDCGIFSELIELDDGGYSASAEDCTTKTPGVFTAGDCRRKTVRQLTTATADGAVAAIAACSYVDSL